MKKYIVDRVKALTRDGRREAIEKALNDRAKDGWVFKQMSYESENNSCYIIFEMDVDEYGRNTNP